MPRLARAASHARIKRTGHVPTHAAISGDLALGVLARRANDSGCMATTSLISTGAGQAPAAAQACISPHALAILELP